MRRSVCMGWPRGTVTAERSKQEPQAGVVRAPSPRRFCGRAAHGARTDDVNVMPGRLLASSGDSEARLRNVADSDGIGRCFPSCIRARTDALARSAIQPSFRGPTPASSNQTAREPEGGLHPRGDG